MERTAIGMAIEEEVGKRQGRGNQYEKTNGQSASCQLQGSTLPAPGQQTAAFVAEKAGFSSEATYRRAKQVLQRGSAELQKAVDEGAVSITRAAKVVALPERQQLPAAMAITAAHRRLASDHRQGCRRRFALAA